MVGCLVERGSGLPNWDSHRSSPGESQSHNWERRRVIAKVPACHSLKLGETVRLTLDTHILVGHSMRAPEDEPTAQAIAVAIEQATSEQPTDRLINPILETAKKLDLPEEIIIRWIHEKCREVRARRYPLRPGLLARAFEDEIIGWCRSNQHIVGDIQTRRDSNEPEVLRRAKCRTRPRRVRFAVIPASQIPGLDFQHRATVWREHCFGNRARSSTLSAGRAVVASERCEPNRRLSNRRSGRRNARFVFRRSSLMTPPPRIRSQSQLG